MSSTKYAPLGDYSEQMNRETVLFVSCSHTLTYSQTIKYVSDSTRDYYFISRVPAFRQYIGDLAGRSSRTVVVLLYNDISLLVEVLSVLSQGSTGAKIKISRDSYADTTKIEVSEASDVPSHYKSELHSGQADLPLGFDVVLLLDSTEVGNDHLSESNVVLQQILRFVALKHGASFGAISGLQEVFSNPFLINGVLAALLELNLRIYDPEGVHTLEDIRCHQLVPLGWDSWNKIELLGKSIPRTSDRILLDKKLLLELSKTYDDYFESVGIDGAQVASKVLHGILNHYLETSKETELELQMELKTYANMLESLAT